MSRCIGSATALPAEGPSGSAPFEGFMCTCTCIAGTSIVSDNLEEGEEWDNQDAADLDAQAYLQDLAHRPDMHQQDAADAQVHDEDAFAETMQQVGTWSLCMHTTLYLLYYMPRIHTKEQRQGCSFLWNPEKAPESCRPSPSQASCFVAMQPD